ncbi:hypothetical protein [Streptomyces sp. NPDC048442]|uniref:hypothetical protein n=1 Tax=Streptomyces sp. NPDC048442 TaxID=3154823 RepID=UPI00341C23E7
MNLRPRPCTQCGEKVAEYGRKRCFSCLYPSLPPPVCETCGSDNHYVGGYCRRCHPRVISADNCSDCFAWGIWRRRGLCAACISFRNRGHRPGGCLTCGRTVPLKKGVCRLCHCQARAIPRTWQRPDLTTAATTGQQLFLADQIRRVHLAGHHRSRTSPATVRHQPRALCWTVPRWRQDRLVDAARDMSRVTVPDVVPLDPAFTDYIAVQADNHADAQGWSPGLRERVQQSLYLLTAVHGPHETIKASTVATLPRQQRRRAVLRVTEILATLELLNDDRPDPLDGWIHRRLSRVHPEIAAGTLVWINIVRHGGPRRRPRSPATVRNQLTAAIPFLLACSERYCTLRQVTRSDLTEWLAQCAAPHNEAVALRSMFKTLKSQRLLFTNPARGVSLGARPGTVPKPLSPEAIKSMAESAATDPALKLLIALIGIHALYPHQARALPMSAIDFVRGRLTFGDIDHPLDTFARQAAADYIELRREGWPNTRNPHLFISSQTAYSRAAATIGWMQVVLRGLPVTAQRLREDRILEEPPLPGPTHSICARSSTSLQRPDCATSASSNPSTWKKEDRVHVPTWETRCVPGSGGRTTGLMDRLLSFGTSCLRS